MARKTLDIGDNEVTWEWDGDLPFIVSVVPHFDGARSCTEEEMVQDILEHEAEHYAALESLYWDQKIDEARGC